MGDEQGRGMKEEESHASEEMLGKLGHELGNCLAPIRNALRLMEHQNVDARTVDYARGVIQQQLVELEKLSRRLMGGATLPAGEERTEKGRRILIADDNRAW